MRPLRLAGCALGALLAVVAAATAPAAAAMDLNSEFALSTYQAGGHPDAEISFSVAASSGETLKSVAYVLNTGFTFEPASLAACPNVAFANRECGPDSQLGVVTVRGAHEGNPSYLLGTAPVYNLTPVPGQFARVGFRIPTIEEPVIAVGSLPTAPEPPALDPYQLRFTLDGLPQTSPVSSVSMTLWGVPAAAGHDADRFPQGSPGCPGSATTACNTPTASSLTPAPFTLDAVYCEPNQPFLNWDPVDVYSTYQGFKNEHTAMFLESGGCDLVSFDPDLSAAPSTNAGHSEAGLELVVHNPQLQRAAAPSQSELQTAAVTMRGLLLDPKLSEHPVCEEAAAAITGNQASACPPASKVGTATIEVKGLSEKIQGQIYLGNTVAEKLRVFVVGTGGGLELKLLGFVERLSPPGLKLTFGAQPRLPIAEEALHFLPDFVRTPVHCGEYSVEGKLVPWAPSLATQEPKSTYSVSTGPAGPCIGAAANVAVQLDPASIPADGVSQSNVTVTVRDAGGTGVPSEDIEIGSSDPSQKIGEVVDHGDGIYTATVTGSATVGRSTITATDLSGPAPIVDSAELVQYDSSHPPPPASQPVFPEGTPPPPPRAPTVRFLTKPPRHGRKRVARFDFAADAPGATFTCSLDHRRYRPCRPPVLLHHLSVGPHSFSVRAADGSLLGPASSWRFRVVGARSGHHRHR